MHAVYEILLHIRDPGLCRSSYLCRPVEAVEFSIELVVFDDESTGALIALEMCGSFNRIAMKFAMPVKPDRQHGASVAVPSCSRGTIRAVRFARQIIMLLYDRSGPRVTADNGRSVIAMKLALYQITFARDGARDAIAIDERWPILGIAMFPTPNKVSLLDDHSGGQIRFLAK